jgi:hypothetical protein
MPEYQIVVTTDQSTYQLPLLHMFVPTHPALPGLAVLLRHPAILLSCEQPVPQSLFEQVAGNLYVQHAGNQKPCNAAPCLGKADGRGRM